MTRMLFLLSIISSAMLVLSDGEWHNNYENNEELYSASNDRQRQGYQSQSHSQSQSYTGTGDNSYNVHDNDYSKQIGTDADDIVNDGGEQTYSSIEFDEYGVGFVTISLYGLLFWQFMSLAMGMCLCGVVTMCYQKFREVPSNKNAQQW